MVPIAIRLYKKPPNTQSPSIKFLYLIVISTSLFYSTEREKFKKDSGFSVSSIFSITSTPFLCPVKVSSNSNNPEYVFTVVLSNVNLKNFGFV